jgi:hypothetical protein
MRPIEDYGNKLSIIGFIVGNGEEHEIIFLEHQNKMPNNIETIQPTEYQLSAIFNQLDTLQITNSQKTVLRKSQRQIDQVVAWTVYRRDDYSCVYCGKNEVPLTYDHLVLWEEMGDTTVANGVAACKKCNHTRGNTELPVFLESDYFKSVCKDEGETKDHLLHIYKVALTLPRRKPRSR